VKKQAPLQPPKDLQGKTILTYRLTATQVQIKLLCATKTIYSSKLGGSNSIGIIYIFLESYLLYHTDKYNNTPRILQVDEVIGSFLVD